MHSSAKARVLLAVLRRWDVAWKTQQQGGTKASRQLRPRLRRALADPLTASGKPPHLLPMTLLADEIHHPVASSYLASPG